jgi:hypothetical protein
LCGLVVSSDELADLLEIFLTSLLNVNVTTTTSIIFRSVVCGSTRDRGVPGNLIGEVKVIDETLDLSLERIVYEAEVYRSRSEDGKERDVQEEEEGRGYNGRGEEGQGRGERGGTEEGGEETHRR